MALLKIYLGNILIMDTPSIAAAIGSEAASATNCGDIVNIINNDKILIANNLVTKNVSASSSESLASLANKISTVPTNDPAPIAQAIGSEISSSSSINTIASTVTSDKQALVSKLSGYGISMSTASTLIDLINGIDNIIGTKFRTGLENLGTGSFLNSITKTDLASALLVGVNLQNPTENLQDGSFLNSIALSDSLVGLPYTLDSLIMTTNSAGSSLNLIPVMSNSNTYPFGVAIASGYDTIDNLGNYPWKAFNNTTLSDSGADCWRSDTTDAAWLGYQFVSGNYVNKYDVISVNQATVCITQFPKAWTFEGSNNGTDWTVLDTQTAQTVSGAAQTKTYTFSNNTAYSYFRINVTAVGTAGNLVAIGELKMYSTNSGTVSASTIFSSTFDVWKAFNQTVTDANDGWKTSNGTVTGWLKFQSNASRIFKMYEIFPLNDSTNGVNSFPKNWTFEGSNDNSNWDMLDTRINQSISSYTNAYNVYTINNTTSYAYYRINITANNGNALYTSIGDFRMYQAGY